MRIADSNVLIDWLRGDDGARDVIRGAFTRGEPIAASVLTRTELLHGLQPEERPAFDRLLAALDWIPVTSEIADAAGLLAAEYRRSHRTIETVDYVIAATARAFDCRLWTRNVRHFPMFPDLEPPY